MATELTSSRPVAYTFGDIFIEGWRQFRKNFLALLIVYLCVYLPVNLVLAFFPASPFDIASLGRSLSSWYFLLPFLLGFLFGSLASLAAALIVEGSLRGERLSAWRGLGRALRRWPAALGTGLLVAVILLGLSLLLVLPGIFWGAATVFWLYAVAVRKLGFKDALLYSWHVIKGRWWQVFGAWLVLTLLVLTAATLLGRLAGLISSSPFLAILPNTLVSLLLALRDAMLVILFLNLEALCQPALPSAARKPAPAPAAPAESPAEAPAQPSNPWARPAAPSAASPEASSSSSPSSDAWARPSSPSAAPAESSGQPPDTWKGPLPTWADSADPAADTAERRAALARLLAPLPVAPPEQPVLPAAPPPPSAWAAPRLGRNYQATAGLVLGLFAVPALALLVLLPGSPVDWLGALIVVCLAALLVSALGLRASGALSGEGRRPAAAGVLLGALGLAACGIVISTPAFGQAWQATLAYSDLFPPNTPQVVRVGEIQLNVPAGWRRVNPATVDNCQSGPGECLLVIQHVNDLTNLVVQRVPLLRAVSVDQLDGISWREVQANAAGLNLVSLETLRIAGQPAIRRIFNDQENGAQAQYIYIWLVKGLTAYQIQSFSPNPQTFQAHQAELKTIGESLAFVP